MSTEVYIVLHDWGMYEDWQMEVAGVFAELDDAKRYIRGQGRTVTLCRDGSYAELGDFDDVDAIGTVTIAPVEEKWYRAFFSDKTVGGGWSIPDDPDYDSDSWHIERWEVQR